MAIAPLHLALSRTARPYTIALLLWMFVLAAAWRAWRSGTKGNYALLAGTATLFLLSRGDLPVFALGALAVAFAVLRNWRGVAALAAAAALYLPFLVLIVHRSTQYVGQRYPGNLRLLAADFVELASPAPWLLIPLMALGVVHVLTLHGVRRNMAVSLLLVSLLTVLLHCCYFLGFVTWPIFPRYLLYVLFPVTILAGFGAQWLMSVLPAVKTVRMAAQLRGDRSQMTARARSTSKPNNRSTASWSSERS